jgi:hypothetical protein
VHLKGRASGFAFLELEIEPAFFLERLFAELLRLTLDAAELAEAVECADELLHSLPKLVVESDRRNGSLVVGERSPCVLCASIACEKPMGHAGPLNTCGDSDCRIGGPCREYKLRRRGNRDLYAGLSL